jgi:CheY-like chemotaxis protein
MSERPFEILLVEDNFGDVILIEECLQTAEVPYQLTHCDTIRSALKAISGYRAGEGKIPDLLLLDYNLPAGEAREVLQAAVTNPALHRMKKAVITSSMSPRDREDALRNGAECVIRKPSELDSFLTEVGKAIVKLLGDVDARAGL